MIPKSRIVDVTNYLMLLTGQPLHAFDADKFLAVGGTNTVEISVRLARDGEEITLLDGAEVVLNSDDIVICSGEVPVALAGAMGGESTKIDEHTKNVILESASFSLYNLRKTQMAHGIFSEAITRFTKGVPASGTFNVLAEAIKEINAKPLELKDAWPGFCQPNVVKITTGEINGLLGTDYTYSEVEQTLRNVGFEILCDCGKADSCKCEEISVIAPIWRTDIHIKEDVIEEVGRLLGYDNIPVVLPLHGTASKNHILTLKRDLRSRLSRYGANEVITYSFVSEKLLQKVGQDPKNSYKIVNSISPELQFVRQSIVPSLLEKAYINEKLPVDRFLIFEMNKIYRKEWGIGKDGTPEERNWMGLVLAERKTAGAAFYKMKKYVAEILSVFDAEVEYVALKTSTAEAKLFEPKRAAAVMINGEYGGVIGELKNSVRNNFKLAPFVAAAELDVDILAKLTRSKKVIQMGRTEERDLTVTTDEAYGSLLDRVNGILEKYQASATIKPLGIYRPDGATKNNISLRLVFDNFNSEAMSELEKL